MQKKNYKVLQTATRQPNAAGIAGQMAATRLFVFRIESTFILLKSSCRVLPMMPLHLGASFLRTGRAAAYSTNVVKAAGAGRARSL